MFFADPVFHTLRFSLLLTTCILFRLSIIYSGYACGYTGYAWIRSNMTTSWYLDRHTIISGGFARCCTRLIFHMISLRTTPAYFLNNETLCGGISHTCAMLSSNFLLFAIVHFCDRVFLMSGWVCQWKPFWIPVGDDGSICDPGENFLKHFLKLLTRRQCEDPRTKTVRQV